MNKIALIGAFDRDNYGDILMPIVFEEYMRKMHPDFYSNKIFEYYALREQNMEYLAGKNTKSLSTLTNRIDDFESLIVVGGAILPCRYGNMFIHLQENLHLIKLYRFCDLFLRPFFDLYCKKRLHGENIRPWILENVSDKKVIYNTVGGSLTPRKLLFHKKRIIKALMDASYISVRDETTQYYLKCCQIPSKLYPDSVICLSRVISDNVISNHTDCEKINAVKALGSYVVIQMNAKVGESLVDEMCCQLEKLYNQYNVGCILLPIGRATGHEDQIPLQKIAQKLSTPCYMPKTNNVYETIYLIKNSTMYCGTSLHGAITSISYCIPHVALTNKIPKLNDFLSTWDTTPIKNVEPNDFIDAYKQLVGNSRVLADLKEKSSMLQKLVMENFENIHTIIEKDDHYAG